MQEIVSLIVANGLWAVLFCALLYYQLRDSRAREQKYTQTIRALSERLSVVTAVKADTTDIKADTVSIKSDTRAIKKSLRSVDSDKTQETDVGDKKAESAKSGARCGKPIKATV